MTSINAAAPGSWHPCGMIKQHAHPPASNSAATAERLRAHARLCFDVAQGCYSRETAAEFERMAQACARVAEELAPGATLDRIGNTELVSRGTLVPDLVR
ncbi:MAG: hypothetical protein P8Y71_28225 [Pseudolabrys sp.]